MAKVQSTGGRSHGRKAKPASKLSPMTITWPTDGMATYDQAAGFLQISKRSIERLVSKGELNTSNVSRRCVRVPWADLHEFVRKRRGSARREFPSLSQEQTTEQIPCRDSIKALEIRNLRAILRELAQCLDRIEFGQ